MSTSSAASIFLNGNTSAHTADLKRQLSEHNAGSAHTAKFKPRKLVWYCAFPDKCKALAFEKYLKSHSGRAFAKKRL
jgi:putative endonuclease